MIWFALGIAMLVATAIIAIGTGYVTRPRAMAGSFGLPLPHAGPDTAWWLRLKGIRDIASGLLVLAFLVCGTPRDVGIVMLVAAAIPLGDMTVVLAAKGSGRTAFGIHGLTAGVMIVAAIILLTGR